MTSLYDCGLNACKTVCPSTTAPTNPSTGDLWFDLTTNEWKKWDGTNWGVVASGGGGGINFPPPVDTSQPPVPPTGGFQSGMIIIHPGPDGAKVDAGYTGAAGKTINTGDMLIFDGTAKQWHVITNTLAFSKTDLGPAIPGGIEGAWTALTPKPTEQIIYVTYDGDTYAKIGAGAASTDWLLIEHPFVVSVTPLTKTTANATVDAAYGALATKPNSPLRVLTFDGATYLVTGAGTAPTDFHILGGKPIQFADPAEVLAGTVTDKIIAPDALQSRITGTPDATPANDARKLVMLGAGGKIANGFLSFGALTYIGAIDQTVPYVAPAQPYEIGSFGVIGTAGTADASWAAVGVTGAFDAGDLLVWNGTSYDTVEHAGAYVQLAGANALAADQTMTWGIPAGAGMVTRLDGGDNTKAQIENFHLKDCTADAGSF